MNIIWTEFAVKSLKIIFDYYSIKANKKIAAKLKDKIISSVNILTKYPESGQKEILLNINNQNYRYILIENYKIIYFISDNKIIITDVFDVRQNPININNPDRNI